MTRMPSRAFTLIELLVVLAVIGVLASIIAVNLSGATDRARIAKSLEWQATAHRLLGTDAAGWWNFNEGEPGTCPDSKDICDHSGLNNHGSALNNPFWRCEGESPSGKGCSLEFDEANKYVRVADAIDSLGINGEKEITVSAWIYPWVIDDAASRYILDSWGGIRFHLTRTWTTNTYFYVRTTDYTERSLNFGALSPDQWYFLTYTYNADDLLAVAYINGKEVNSREISGTIVHTNNSFDIGSGSYLGLIDDVRIYRRALTTPEIRRFYSRTKYKYLAYTES